jgi:hypothetical protein
MTPEPKRSAVLQQTAYPLAELAEHTALAHAANRAHADELAGRVGQDHDARRQALPILIDRHPARQ